MPDLTHAAALDDDASPQRLRIIWLLRALFLVLLITFTSILIVKDSESGSGLRLVNWWPLAVLGAFSFFAGVVAVDILTSRRKLSTISAVFVGLIAGVIVTFILGLVMDLFADVYGLGQSRALSPIKVMIGLGVCYLTIATVIQTQNDFRLVIPYVEFARQRRGVRPLILDSSALIDARMLDLAGVGLLQAPIIIPRFVIEELQRLADSGDRAKRARGRRGLDTVTKLQRSPRLDVKIDDTAMPAAPVDQMLIELARLLPGIIITTDTGLLRMASIQNVTAVNMHDVAAAVQPAVIPGETITIRLIRRGEQPAQAVGYMPDGTMVVAEHAETLVGHEAVLTVTGSVQTSAGRLIFARPTDRDAADTAGSDNMPAEPDHPAIPAPIMNDPAHGTDDAGAPDTERAAAAPEPSDARRPLPTRRTLRNPRR